MNSSSVEGTRLSVRVVVSSPSGRSSIRLTVRYFPHGVSDLSIILAFCEHPSSLYRDERQWALRHIILMWLSLTCMIPFDLGRFDTGDTKASMRIESLGKEVLSKSGLEREAGALVLARLYSRYGTSFDPYPIHFYLCLKEGHCLHFKRFSHTFRFFSSR